MTDYSEFSRFRMRAGFVPVRKGRGIVLIESQRETELIQTLLDVLHARYPRMNIFRVSSADQQKVAEYETLLPWPFGNHASLRRLFAHTKAHVLLLAPGARVSPSFVDTVRNFGIKVALVGKPLENDKFVERANTVFDWDGTATNTGDMVEWAKNVAKELETDLVMEHRPGKKPRPIESFGRLLLNSGLLNTLLAHKYERIESLDEFRDRLGNPGCIMALGNGPSSEDPRVLRASYDALFRVNHSWLHRGFFDHADVVFTLRRATVKEHKAPTIFTFQTTEGEENMRLKCLTIRGKIHYTVAECLGSITLSDFGIYRPTNGAVMLSTAVALRPRKLIVGGIDLFSHPAGSYPGDTSVRNAYSLTHDRDTELRFILRKLSQFDGELEIISEVLEMEWDKYQRDVGALAEP